MKLIKALSSLNKRKKFYKLKTLTKRQINLKMRITHADVWKRKPYERNSFNSDEIYLALPSLNKKKIKKGYPVYCLE